MGWTLAVRWEIEGSAGDDVMKGVIDGLSDHYRVWANKVRKQRPLFCKADTTLVMSRKWVAPFYQASNDTREVA